MEKLLGSVAIPPEIIDDIEKNVRHIADFTKKIEAYISQNTTNLLDLVLFGAIHLQASDIHLEPQEDQIRLRIRLDGILQDAALFDRAIYHNLLNRIKLLSKIKLNITDKPQDGRFTIEIKDLLLCLGPFHIVHLQCFHQYHEELCLLR